MRRSGRFWLILGLVLAGAAFTLLAMWWVQERAAARSVSAVLRQMEETLVSEQGGIPAEKRDEIPGLLVIPALGLRLPVAEEWSEAALEKSPCRYAGAGEGGGLVIAGHNYAAHFGKLRRLEVGETVSFTDWQGRCRDYRVAATEILQAGDVEKMVGGEWDLTLFTCTPGGERRFTLRCEELSGEKAGE